jgi:hypothetical protein
MALSSYQNCRWYDLYPGLAFILKLIRLMPHEKQCLLGQRLDQYLIHRGAVLIREPSPNPPRGNRWYDEVEPLVSSLEHLKQAPDPVKRQSTDYLMKLVEEFQPAPRCA